MEGNPTRHFYPSVRVLTIASHLRKMSEGVAAQSVAKRNFGVCSDPGSALESLRLVCRMNSQMIKYLLHSCSSVGQMLQAVLRQLCSKGQT